MGDGRSYRQCQNTEHGGLKSRVITGQKKTGCNQAKIYRIILKLGE